jgi:UDP-glucuronate decarboxylase
MEDDPRRRCPDINRAGVALGWTPIVPLEDGLLRTIAHASEVERGESPIGVLAP